MSLSIYDISDYLMQTLRSICFPHRTSFIVSHRFGSTMISFSFNSRIFLFLLYFFDAYSVVCCLISVFSKGSISLWWDRIHDTFIFAIYFENYIVSNLTCNFENVLWAFSKKECDVICFSRFFSFGLYANSSLVVLVSH